MDLGFGFGEMILVLQFLEDLLLGLMDLFGPIIRILFGRSEDPIRMNCGDILLLLVLGLFTGLSLLQAIPSSWLLGTPH